MSEPYVMSAALCRRRTGAQGSLPEKACEADSMGLLLRLFFFIGAIKTTKHPQTLCAGTEKTYFIRLAQPARISTVGVTISLSP